MRNTGFAGDGEAPELRPADEAGLGAERERLDDIAAAAHAAVDEDRDAPFDGRDNVGQSVDRRRRTVELAAAMVRHDEPVNAVIDRRLRLLGMKNALED